jgi:putative FmdB family regulatory protein
MPLYEYECSVCGHRFELIQRFADPPAERCVSCGKEPVHKLLSAPAIHFKGTGWYVTDYANKKSDGSPKSDSSSQSDESSKADGSSKSDGSSKTDGASKSDSTSSDATPPASSSSSADDKKPSSSGESKPAHDSSK